MVFKVQSILLVTLACAFCLISASTVMKSVVGDCYDHVCPVGTYSCKKHTYPGQDKAHLEIDVSCLDREKNAIQTFHERKVNPYGKGVHYESYSYSSVFLFEKVPPKYEQGKYNYYDTNSVNNGIK